MNSLRNRWVQLFTLTAFLAAIDMETLHLKSKQATEPGIRGIRKQGNAM